MIYSECMLLALVLQHAMCIHHTFIVACSAINFFSTLSHKRHDFRKVSKHKKSALMLPTIFCEIFLILRRSESDIIINVHRSSYKVSLILVIYRVGQK